MDLNKEEIREIKETKAYKDAFRMALEIHQQIHKPKATHFQDCIECKCGFGLLLSEGLKEEYAPPEEQERFCVCAIEDYRDRPDSDMCVVCGRRFQSGRIC